MGGRMPSVRVAGSPRNTHIARDSLNFPKTFKREANLGSFPRGRSLVGANGKYQVWVRFSGQNAFGVRSGHVATAFVDAKTCKLDFSSVVFLEAR